MNKDVIYIEPEDDITDILTGIKNSKAKVVALVPPKKAAVLKSAVNFKLLARTAKETEKAVVLITTDSALLKLATVAKIPVSKNLQTKPEVPVGDIVENEEEDVEADVIDGDEAIAIVKEDKKISKTSEDAAIESVDLTEEDATDDTKDGKKKSKKGKKDNEKKSIVPNFEKYRKFIIAGAIGLVLIVGFLVWALVFAPSAKIIVSVKTTSRQFSENVSFVTEESNADPSEGIFLLEAQTLTSKSTVDFEATGELDKGEKATGTLTFKRTSAASIYTDAITISKGTKFTVDGLTFVTTADAALAALDASNSNCSGPPSNIVCSLTKDVTATAAIEASEAGTKYNIDAAASGWAPAGKGYSISGSAVTGGTSNIVKVVSADDIAKAKQSLSSVSSSEGRADLLDEFPAGLIPISSSFKSESGEPVSSPVLGETVASGKTATLTVETKFTMYGVDSVRVSEFIEIKTKASVGGNDQKVYSTGVSDNDDENKAFIESFRETEGKYTAKLKTTTKTGPEVTDEMVLDKSLGRKIGEVQSLLKSINGVSSVNVETSFFWVSSVPKNINKVSVEITVE